MQQPGETPGAPGWRNTNASPPQQYPPYAIPGLTPRQTPPSWQAPPPGNQFRLQPGVGHMVSGPPVASNVAEPLAAVPSPAGTGPRYGSGVGRPAGPPGIFQPSQSQPTPYFHHPMGVRPPGAGAIPMRPPPQTSTSLPQGQSLGTPLPPNSPRSSLTGSLPPLPQTGAPVPGFSVAPTPPSSYPPFPPGVAAPPTPGDAGLFPRMQVSQPRPGTPFSAVAPQQSTSTFGQPVPQLGSSQQFGSPSIPRFGSPSTPQYSGGPPSQGYYSGAAIPSAQPQYTADGPPMGTYGGPLPVAPPPLGGYGASFNASPQGLVEDFQSLSLVPLPGSVESGVDPGTLPRPLDTIDLSVSRRSLDCHPRYLRLTTNAMPNSHSLMSRWHLPLGAVAHPLAEAPPGEEVQVVNYVGTTIVRCRRCRTYINPYVTFTDGGRRWRCNICVLLNEVPVEYFCALDENGRRRDVNERPELSQGSVEFVAPTEYMVRPPMPPVYFFLIDVSVSAIKMGMLKVVAETIKASLDKLPGFPRTQIGILTFDSTLHFYNLKVWKERGELNIQSSLTQPQMMVVADLDDPFLPLPDDLLVNLSESRAVVEALLDSLPTMFENNLNIESALGPALKASFMVMSQLGGKLLVFQSTLPSLGVGRLKLRGDDPRIYGTDKENQMRVTEEQFYKQMAADFSKYQIGVNIYAFAERYTDLASLGTSAKYTGGQVCYYPGFQAHLHGEKLRYELARDLSRETAWEAVMRIRCGKGVRFSSFHGHFMLRSSDLMALPAVDCDKAFAMQLTLEDTLLTTNTVYFQVALLYTSSTGERRIRVHTMATPVVNDLAEMYRAADIGAITSIMSRLAVEKSLQSKLEDARQSIQQRLIRSLREYRNMFAVQHRTSNRLIFPESLKLLPFYTLAICKCLALRGGFNDATPDERSAISYEIMTMPVSRLLKFLYPSLCRFDEYLQGGKTEVDGKDQLPPPVPLASERLDPRGAFLLDDGLRFVLWLGKVLPSDLVIQVLGPESAYTTDLSKVAVIEHANAVSKRLVATIQSLRESNPAVYQLCTVVRQGEQPREGNLLLANLVEDRTAGAMGYSDWVVQTYRQVSQKTS